MRIEQIWTGNDFRNFHYLIACCSQTGEALVVDPLDHALCLSRAQALGLQITQIVNTHEHTDHTGGNEPMRAATGALLLAQRSRRSSDCRHRSRAVGRRCHSRRQDRRAARARHAGP